MRTDSIFTLIVLFLVCQGTILNTIIKDRELGLFFNPFRMYELTKMNMVGCWCSSIAMYVILPIIGFPYLIFTLFHIGRNEEEQGGDDDD